MNQAGGVQAPSSGWQMGRLVGRRAYRDTNHCEENLLK